MEPSVQSIFPTLNMFNILFSLIMPFPTKKDSFFLIEFYTKFQNLKIEIICFKINKILHSLLFQTSVAQLSI